MCGTRVHMLWLRLDGEGTLQRQLYRALRDAILGGRLPPGSRLPATRALGRELGLSRNTVLLACEQLLAEGYATPRPRSGLFVVDALPARAAPVERPPQLRLAAASAAPALSAVA